MASLSEQASALIKAPPAGSGTTFFAPPQARSLQGREDVKPSVPDKPAGMVVRPAPRTRTVCPNCDYGWDPAQPRSLPQHRRFFGMVKIAFENWPEKHARQFNTVLECRKYLTAKAGWYDVTSRIPLDGLSPERAILLATAGMQGAGAYAIATVHHDELVIIAPRSICFDKMGPKEFSDLSDKVADVIGRETGIDVLERLGTEARHAE